MEILINDTFPQFPRLVVENTNFGPCEDELQVLVLSIQVEMNIPLR